MKSHILPYFLSASTSIIISTVSARMGTGTMYPTPAPISSDGDTDGNGDRGDLLIITGTLFPTPSPEDDDDGDRGELGVDDLCDDMNIFSFDDCWEYCEANWPTTYTGSYGQPMISAAASWQTAPDGKSECICKDNNDELLYACSDSGGGSM
jgi:hypothetical protein